jgi:hypothetical protein
MDLNKPQQLCAACLSPVAEADMTQQIALEMEWRKNNPDEATNDDAKRVILCDPCFARLKAIKEHQT